MQYRIAIVLSLLVLSASAAQAVEILVISPGTMANGLRALGAEWAAKTGNKVTVKGGTVGSVAMDAAGSMPADIVVLPREELAKMPASLKPGTVAVGLAQFGLSMKAGLPKPDISTLPKFIAVLRAGGALAFPDPATGSGSGKRVAAMLERPDFAGIRPVPSQNPPRKPILEQGLPYSGGTMSEQINIPGIQVAGTFPAELNIDIHYSGAVLARTASPRASASFLRFISRPEAAATLVKTGIAAPKG